MKNSLGKPVTNFIILYDLTTNQYIKNIFYSSEIGLINSISWKPNDGYTLAANGDFGACLFKFVPNLTTQSKLGNNSMSTLTTCWIEKIYSSDNRGPKAPKNNDSKSLAFSQDGNLLILGYNYSQRGNNNSFMVVDPATNEKSLIKRAAINLNIFSKSSLVGISSCKFSNDGLFLVTSHTQNNELRLWSTENWNCKVFGFLPGLVTNFCWFPNCNACFFLVEGCRDILVLVVEKTATSFDASISIVCSFESHITPMLHSSSYNENDTQYLNDDSRNEEIRVGGPISKMAFDPSGNRLVIAFEPDCDSSCDSSILAVYKVQQEFLFKAGGDLNANQSVLVPLGYIRGPGWPTESFGYRPSNQNNRNNRNSDSLNNKVKLGQPTPTHLLFAPRFENGSLLVVAWSSGKISFIPMIY
ncbi:hypothetical protein AYI69_g4118 [Smittium culicis]|uniref:WD repeat-containing protein WRAP73 n=1 Tax=Smittium culicis TaxID=133412 RepID=A0A1R1YGF2_9FUNG|nr:hypothetical protein AYI69_g4118 [Smittium culicis]